MRILVANLKAGHRYLAQIKLAQASKSPILRRMASDFDHLTPDVILKSIEQAGYLPTGEYSQLNSYENRVFDIRLEVSTRAPSSEDRLIAKFYRPGRWSSATIQDEHDFLSELHQNGVTSLTPLPLKNGKTWLKNGDFIFSVFQKIRGSMPQEFLPGELVKVGRVLARIHNVGAQRRAPHRNCLTAEALGWPALNRAEPFVYPDLQSRYVDAASELLEQLEDALDSRAYIRIHGDCHRGNLIYNREEFFFVDFDDMLNGPPEQDFWMLLGAALGTEEADGELEELLTGYSELREPPENWELVSLLRGLRIISYSGWIAQRWQDQSFQRLFPGFTTFNHWAEEVEQLEALLRA